MTNDEALSKLELEQGATSSEINTQYQEFYNEFQMRITNAPTEHQRKLYQKKLEELAAAFEVLGGENPGSNTQELPGISVTEVVETEKSAKPSVSNQAEMSKQKALQILGLGEKFTSKELENAFRSKVSSCETGRDNAMNDVIRSAYTESWLECNAAHALLKLFVFVPASVLKTTPTTPQVSKVPSKSKKKWILPISIVSGVIILIILFFAFGNRNTDEIIDPAIHDKYVSLKSQADLLANQGNWQEALDKYEAVFLLAETSEVKDSIESMKKHLLLASVEKEDGSDEQKQEANVEKEKDAAVTKKEKELVARENALKEAERLRQEKEAERLRQEKESKPIKIGDKYAGGIVFKIDAGGEHGLVCAPTYHGSKITPNEAKNVCLNLTLNGYSDWYLPSKYELNLIYINIGRGSSNGNIGKGISIGNNGWTYWSSTEGSVTHQAWEQSFWDGNQHENYTGNCLDRCFRAIRAF